MTSEGNVRGSAKVRPAPGAGVRRVGDEIFILAPSGDLVILTNESAIALWTALENGTDTEEELVRHLTGSFEVLPERAAADVAVFLGELRRRGLVLETG